MSSISFDGNNDALQVAVNNGSINYLSPATAVSTDRLLDNDFWRHLSVTIPREDRIALKRKKGGPAPGTCEWVLRTKELTTWLGSGPTVGPESQLAQVLWFYGNPGTGKSIMTIYLTEELSEAFSHTDGKTLAYFFCDSGFNTRKTTTSIVKGLLYQLVKQHEKLLDYILPKYHERGTELFTSFDALWEIFMAMVADQNTGLKYCIIDALDECDRESQEILLLQLEETFRSRTISSNVRILVTSRPYPEIRESLQIFPNKDLASFAQREKDVDLFIEQKVDELTQKKNYTDKVKLQVRRILQDKSEGTFLWIGLACDELKNIPSNRVVHVLQNIPQGLNSLYRKLLKMALKQSETSGNDIRRLLSCVAVSSRPLTVSELSEVCQLHQEEEDLDTRLQFTHEYIESCHLMIIIQDEKVLLLHKSIKDYLVGTSSGNFIQEIEAHAHLAYRCVDILIEQFRGTNQLKSSFLGYATLEWGNHARMAGSSFRVKFPQAEFFQIFSPCREWWLRKLKSRLPFIGIPTRFSIFHVAAEWGICALVDHAFELGVQESDIERTTYVVHVNCRDDSGKMPLEYAVGSRYPNAVAALLSRGGKVTIQVVKAAAANTWNGEAVMTLLLDRCGDQITITDEVVKAAAENREDGGVVMTLLLDRYGDQITITDLVVSTIARAFDKKIMALLLDRCGDQITITDEVVKAAAENIGNGEAVMTLLRDRYGDQITITDLVVSTIARAFDEKIMALLLDHRGDQTTITDEVVKVVAGNLFNGKAVMTLLLDRCGNQITITDEVLKAAARNMGNGEVVIALLLDYRRDQITLTDEVVKAVAGNVFNGKAVMTLLLDRCSDQITITDEVVKATARNSRDGKAVMTLLLDRCGDQITITDEVLKATAGNVNSEVVMTLLLDYRRDQITITNEVVKAVARNVFNGKAVMTLLLDRCGNQITITDEVLKAAARNIGNGEAVMALLLNYRRDQITLTDEVLKAAARNVNGEAVMTLLLNYRRDQITITDEVVKAAARNVFNGKAVMTLLLDRYSDQITLTDEVVKATARNVFNGKVVITLLLDRCSDQIAITDEIVKAAARNREDGGAVMTLLLDRCGDQITITDLVVSTIARAFDEKIMALLLDRRGDQINITDEVVKAAAGNLGNGEAVMTLILDRYGDQITITDEVLKAAAGNMGNGEAVMTLILNRYGDQITITDEVLKATARNIGNGEAVMALLLDRCGDQITITDEVVKAAAGNRWDRKAVMTLLLDRRGDLYLL